MANKKVYQNAVAQIISKIATAMIAIFFVKLLTDYLGVRGYGTYEKVHNYLAIFAVLADLGLYTITVREISNAGNDHKKAREIIGNMMSIRLGLGVGIIFISLFLALFLPGYNSILMLTCIGVTGIFVLFGLFYSSILAVLQAHLKTEFSLVASITGKLVSLSGIIGIIFFLFPKELLEQKPELFFWAFLSLFVAILIGNIVMTGMIYWYSRRVEKIYFSFSWSIAKHLLVLSLPFGIALFCNAIFFKSDIFILSLLEPPSFGDISVGLYRIPTKILEIGLIFGTFLLNSFLPLLTQALNKEDTQELERITQRGYLTLFAAGGALALYCFLNAGALIPLISNESFSQALLRTYTAVDALQIMSIIFLLYFLSSLFMYLLIANNEQSKILWINAFVALFNVIGNILVIPNYSFIGAAYVTVVSQILLLGGMYCTSRHIIQLKWEYIKICFIVGILLFSGTLNWVFIHMFGGYFLQNNIFHPQIGFFLQGVCTSVLFFGFLGICFFVLQKYYKISKNRSFF